MTPASLRPVGFRRGAERAREGWGDSWVVGMSLTALPAATGLRPLTFLPGTLSRYGGPRWRLDGVRQEVVEHTARALRERGREDPIRITGPQLVEGMRIDQLGTAEQLQVLEEAARPVRRPGGAPRTAAPWLICRARTSDPRAASCVGGEARLPLCVDGGARRRRRQGRWHFLEPGARGRTRLTVG
jgi:hypothetical protein